ncbi:MAG: membrane protein insertase YidC [Flavobacterium sp.]|nr:membrane protein insertase YidC [Flavobacterium sp.]
MEENKLDKNSLIGFALIFAIVAWIFINAQPTEKELAAEKAKKAQTEKVALAKNQANQTIQTTKILLTTNDSLQKGKEGFTTLENDLVSLKISNKGGFIVNATLKKFEKYHKDSKQLVELIKDNNSTLNLQFASQDNKLQNTKDLFFVPELSKNGDNQVLSMKYFVGSNEFLEYKYILRPSDYMIDFDVRSQGFNKTFNTSKPLDLEWNLKTYCTEKSVSYENRYTDIRYEYENGKDNNVGQGENASESPENTTFIAFKQHFFSSILLTKTPFKTSKLVSNNLVKDAILDTVFTKQFKANVTLTLTNGEVDYKMNLYFGPTDYKLLKSYDRNIEKIIPLGWGVFGWINKFIFIPLFGFISSYLALGIAIIIFTIIIKIAMSPITYKSFLSSAKMKVLRPEINEIGEKFGKDAMKKQQETMKLYNKAGVNPMAGCVPALIQLPFMYASFQFFPAAIELRQKAFLWASDLSSFDAVLSWKQQIPLISTFYGNHVSLFALLAAIAIFFYTKMTSADNQMPAPTQEGMPDMAKMMKIMLYLSPVMMLIFFNSYGAGLSLYTLISNLITIGIMLVIKNYIIDGDKIHAQIQQNKLKEPKKQGKFRQKLNEVMEQAEAQKALNEKKK